ncbi:MAG: DUF4157 domain-containing protein [Pyrinomonadaceae bacterium]
MLQRKASCACGGGCPACQAKSNNLNISQPNDPAEIEADQIADRVMRMSVDDAKPKSNLSNSADAIQRKCDACDEEEDDAGERPIMRKEAFASASPAPPAADTPPSIRNALSSGGRPLDFETRNFFEPRFGADLSMVRVHTDSAAEQSARSIDAKAYTVGSSIAFGSGEYQPASEAGRHLIAHELAHTQQGSHESIKSLVRRKPKDEVVGRSEPADEQDPEIQRILNAAERAKGASGTSAMISASEVGYRMVKAFVPNYSGTLSSVGYDETGEGVVARKSGDKGVNIELTIGKGFISRLNNSTIMGLTIELREALKATGVQPQPPEKKPEEQIGAVELVRQSQKLLNPPGYKEAKQNHEAQQKKVNELIQSAKEVTRGNSQSDTLLQNSIEWIEPSQAKKAEEKETPPKFGMVVLTPTHDSRTRKPGDDGKRAFFDTRIKYPVIGGDYDPTAASDDGVRYGESGLLGTAFHPPLGVRSAMQFFNINIFIDDSNPITMERLSKTLIHETQHMADRLESNSGFTIAGFERSYQTEFLAYWIEVEVSEKTPLLNSWIDKNQTQTNPLDNLLSRPKKGLGSPANKATSSRVKGSEIKNKQRCLGFYSKCEFETKEQSTNFKNEKQQRIFEHLVENYPNILVDCCYVCDEKYRAIVDNLTGPVGVNIVNSVRIENLLNAVDNCKPDMDVKDSRMDKVMELVKSLDDADIGTLADSLSAFSVEAKAETARQEAEKKQRDAQPRDFLTPYTATIEPERRDVPVSFWLYLMRRLPKAGLKMVQDAVRTSAKSTKKP